MLAPAVFSPLGDTPAVDLTRGLPPEADARILLLDNRDLRNLLYTIHLERSTVNSPQGRLRALDVTCCDADDANVARNVLLLTLILGENCHSSDEIIWKVYYHLYLDIDSVTFLQSRLKDIVSLSQSSEAWTASPFGNSIRFGDVETLRAVHNVWLEYLTAFDNPGNQWDDTEWETSSQQYRNARQSTGGSEAARLRVARAAAPLGLQLMRDLAQGPGPAWLAKAEGDIPNPLFSVHLGTSWIYGQTTLSTSYDPLLNFHLATAKAALAEVQPGKPQDSALDDLVGAAKTQFATWLQALQASAGRPENLIVRFVSADSLAFCHTLQHFAQTGETCANLYRQELSTLRLELDRQHTAHEASTNFNGIYAASVSDSTKSLDVLVAAAPLLEDLPWSTLYMEMNTQGTGGNTSETDQILGGPLATISALLGIIPVEYWTNTSTVSPVDEYMLAASNPQRSSQLSGIRSRLSWKNSTHLDTQAVRTHMHVDSEALASLLEIVYENRFGGTSAISSNGGQQRSLMGVKNTSLYPCAAFIAFIVRMLQSVDTGISLVCDQLLRKTFGLHLSLELSIQGLLSPEAPQIAQPERSATHVLSDWPTIPRAVYLNVEIPHAQWKLLPASRGPREPMPLAIRCRISHGRKVQPESSHVFDAVHMAFGILESSGQQGTRDLSLAVRSSRSTCEETVIMLATFLVPATLLQRDASETSLLVSAHENSQDADAGEGLELMRTALSGGRNAHITRNSPGQTGYSIYSGLLCEIQSADTANWTSRISCSINALENSVSFTGHLDIASDEGRKLLADKAAVKVRKTSLCSFEIILGENEAAFHLGFPAPVAKDGSKTRIARASGYIEVIATLADPATLEELADFMCPAALAGGSPALDVSLPVALAVPYLKMESLPILDLTELDRLGFLTTLTSWMFSARERKLREQTQDAYAEDLTLAARMNFKESLFTMFMLASGLQGGQTGLFAINHPDRGGIHILIFVSAIRLDAANSSVVLDAAVIPFTAELIQSGVLETFLLILRTLECCTLTVDDAELVLWKKALPALTERCRDWSHEGGDGCEYVKTASEHGRPSIPLSVEPGEHVICSCGAGKLPDNFISLPEWETASRYATRVAISPVYASPLVEEIVDPEVLRAAVSDRVVEAQRCRLCGAVESKGGGALKKCMRCQKARYCSAECQKKDWKKHRMECEDAPVVE